MSTKKIDAIKANLIKKIGQINDEQTLIGMAIFAGLAVNDPVGLKAKIATMPTKKAQKSPMKATPEATESRILEYSFGNKKMIAFQANGVPDEAVLTVCKANRMRFYKSAPVNPFNNQTSFWAAPATEELKVALMGVA